MRKKNKTYGKLKIKKEEKKLKSYIQIMLIAILKYTNQKLFTHTNKNITYIYIYIQ